MKTKISANFQPTPTPKQVRATFPDVDPERTLRAFIWHHQSRGTLSEDWDAAFYVWCDNRQRWADQEKRATRDTDSMGLPLDPKKRATMGRSTEGDYGIRFLDAVEQYQALGMTPEQAHAAAVADLEGESE
jgi:hypothetical protein